MKKVGLVVFIGTLVIGIIVARALGYTGSFFNISIGDHKVKESGVMKAEKRDASDFNVIETRGTINIEVVSQKDFDVSVEADESILPYIKTEVDGNTLKVYREGRFSFWGNSRVTVRVAAPEIKQFELMGASTANISNLKQDSFTLECNGASKVSVSGEVRNFTSQANGASKVDAEGLKTERAEVEANGASKSIVYAIDYLQADANGASKISYIGEPRMLDKSAHGASSVSQK